jgi:hypothetical protein
VSEAASFPPLRLGRLGATIQGGELSARRVAEKLGLIAERELVHWWPTAIIYVPVARPDHR